MHRPSADVDIDVAKSLVHRPVRFGTMLRRAPEQRFDTGEELEHAERLGDVVIGAEPEPANLVGLLAPRGENQHRHAQSVFAQRAQHAISIEARQHQIQNHQIGVALPRALETTRTAFGDIDLVALDLEVVPQAEGEVGVVLDDEDSRIANQGLHEITPER
jgi:hypothetical protein